MPDSPADGDAVPCGACGKYECIGACQNPRRGLRLLGALFVAGLALVACGGVTTTRAAATPTAAAIAPIPFVDVGTSTRVLDVLGVIPVKGRAPKTGYVRTEFGPAWQDVDHNQCDTRNDVLIRDLHDEVMRDHSACVVESGILDDPYTGKQIKFIRGVRTSTLVQIDHMVALSDAWQKGAQQLDPATRAALANDPINLVAVDGPTNEAKGDGDAATWLPPNKGYRCSYVAHQVAVKIKYRLWVTEAERNAIQDVLTSCPDQLVPLERAT